jgi:hypothetical protein
MATLTLPTLEAKDTATCMKNALLIALYTPSTAPKVAN